MDPLTVVAFGDSVTNGVGRFDVTDELTFRSLAGDRLGQELGRDMRVINSGVDGDITPAALDRVEREVLAHGPQVATVLFGVNDAGYYRPETDGFADTPRVEEGEFERCLAKIVRRIQSADIKVVLLTPLPMNAAYWGVELEPYVKNGLNYLVERYAQRVRNVARGSGVPLVDTYAHFDGLGDTTPLVPDGIHPNVEGHRIIAELLAPVLVEVCGS